MNDAGDNFTHARQYLVPRRFRTQVVHYVIINCTGKIWSGQVESWKGVITCNGDGCHFSCNLQYHSSGNMNNFTDQRLLLRSIGPPAD